MLRCPQFADRPTPARPNHSTVRYLGIEMDDALFGGRLVYEFGIAVQNDANL